MKTSTINIHDMLSVLSVEEVEKRMGEVPGVESVTVNFAAENATVRYDETRIEATGIKSAVRQKSYESDEAEQSEVKPVEHKAEAPATAPVVKSPQELEAKPVEGKAEAPVTSPVIESPEKDNTESKSPPNKEKADEHAGHKMDDK